MPFFILLEWQPNETQVAEEYCWAITQPSGAVILHPIRFQCDGVWIYLPFLLCVRVCEFDQMCTQFRLAPDLPGCNYCVRLGRNVSTNCLWSLFMPDSWRSILKVGLRHSGMWRRVFRRVGPKVSGLTNFLIFFNLVSLYFNIYWYWYINLTIDGAIYPS